MPGTYRVCVEGVGCSHPFEIRDDVWRKAFYVSVRGLYHQRSGIEIGPPYTSFRRPRNFHPDDGVRVYASTARLMETSNGLAPKSDVFTMLMQGRTAEIVPDAWGGYCDAGDWDRRIQHLLASRLLLELFELFPDYFERFDLNIPGSNDLPDLIREALWDIDFYKRLQTKEGGVRGGIESAGAPPVWGGQLAGITDSHGLCPRRLVYLPVRGCCCARRLLLEDTQSAPSRRPTPRAPFRAMDGPSGNCQGKALPPLPGKGREEPCRRRTLPH